MNWIGGEKFVLLKSIIKKKKMARGEEVCGTRGELVCLILACGMFFAFKSQISSHAMPKSKIIFKLSLTLSPSHSKWPSPPPESPQRNLPPLNPPFTPSSTTTTLKITINIYLKQPNRS